MTEHESTTTVLRKNKKVLIASLTGSAIEWFDYFLYGTAAALVFNKIFFPMVDPVIGLILSYLSFSLTFFIRPIGGVLFAHIGDRVGRKKTLVMTLSIMGLSTVLIGLTPTYAQIGVWSPILLTLLRLLQGLALGGEWGGGVLLAVEYSPANKRGFFGAVPQTGALFGLALGNLVTSGLSTVFSEEAFLSYGWRIPFVLSIVLVMIGMWIRNKVEETPSFRKVADEAKANPKAAAAKKLPLMETLTQHWKPVLIAIGAKFVETSTFFLFATFTISYLVGLGYKRVEALNIVLIASLSQLVFS